MSSIDINKLLESINQIITRRDNVNKLIVKKPKSKNDITDILVSDKIQIPSLTYPLDKTKVQNWLNEVNKCPNKELLPVAKKILEVTKHVSFNEFLIELKKCVTQFETHIGNNSYVMLVPGDIYSYSKKSNYWISKMVYHLLKHKPDRVVLFNDEIDIAEYGNGESLKHILLCDDGVYSGNQMADHVNKIIMNPFMQVIHGHKIDYSKMKIQIHIVCPYVSDIGSEYIMKISDSNNRPIKLAQNDVIIHTNQNTKIFMTPLRLKLSEHEFKLAKVIASSFINKNACPIYFDHKLPDQFSSLPKIYGWGYAACDEYNQNPIKMGSLIENCTAVADIAKEGCPYPPYKAENVNYVKILDKNQFIEYTNKTKY